MKHGLSYLFYKKMLIGYILTVLLVSLFMTVLLVIDTSLFAIYLFIIGILVLCFSPFIIVMAIRLKKSKKAEEWKMIDGIVVDLVPEFSMTPKMYLKAIVEIHDVGTFTVETHPVLNPKTYTELKGKEVQIAFKENEKAYIMVIY